MAGGLKLVCGLGRRFKKGGAVGVRGFNDGEGIAWAWVSKKEKLGYCGSVGRGPARHWGLS